MDQENKNRLFKDFPSVSTKQWEEKIIEDLKGADYEKKLIWKTIDGLSVKPYYRSEHTESIEFKDSLPGEAPYVRSNKKQKNDWEIRQDFEEQDIETANKYAKKALDKGVDSVGLNAADISNEEHLKELIKGIELSKSPVHFSNSSNYNKLAELLKKQLNGQKAKGSFNFDPLGYFVLYEKFYKNFEDNIEDTLQLFDNTDDNLSDFYLININGQFYNNAGASIIQELAFSLSQANEYLAALTSKGLAIDKISPRIMFTIATGSNYFLEIAKFRALRLLWSNIVEQYKPKNEESLKMHLHAVTSLWNKSVYDPYVNMLRTTTEAMSAALAGVDSLSVNTFDETFKKPDAFSYRIARNQQIILKEEAYFDKIVDPAAGSYYIENLTDMIAEAAWKLFVKMEEEGGFIKNVEAGFIKTEIEKTSQQRDNEIAMRKKVFIGTNLYPDTDEKVIDKLEPAAKLTDLGGLRQYRGAQQFEALRLAVENHAKKGFNIPKVFLFTYGNPAMRKARASFSTGFFGLAAYNIIDNLGFKTIDEGIKEAADSGAEIVVFCSSDDEYIEMCEAASKIKQHNNKTIILVAGNPKAIADKLTESGVDGFIHLRTNALEILTDFNNKFGII
ncbi:MAG: acyl-CoA mutase large subunit family protein [Bacteroidales bacterium]